MKSRRRRARKRRLVPPQCLDLILRPCQVFPMTTVEQLIEKTRALPLPLQIEALHYVDHLTEKQSEADIEWSRFSLETTLRGMENEVWPEYQAGDYSEKWQ